MKKLLISLLVFPLIQATSVFANQSSIQSIEIVNESTQALNVAVNSNTQAIKLSYTVPSYTHSLIVSQITKLKSPSEILFEAIVADSAIEINKAIQHGANINQNINGKSPMVWAVLFQRFNSIRHLIELGASLN